MQSADYIGIMVGLKWLAEATVSPGSFTALTNVFDRFVVVLTIFCVICFSFLRHGLVSG